MDTILHVLFIIFAIFFYVGCLSIPLFFGLLFLYIFLRILAFICGGIARLLDKTVVRSDMIEAQSWEKLRKVDVHEPKQGVDFVLTVGEAEKRQEVW